MAIRLGHYDVHLRLGAGGEGRVFLARDRDRQNQILAVKTVHPRLADDPEHVREFESEARISGRLRHVNIVRTFEVEELMGMPILPMEFVLGASLLHTLDLASRFGASLTVGTILAICAQACAGLEHAHGLEAEDGSRLGIVHRDVSPENILVGFDGIVRLSDFGTAISVDRGWQTRQGVIKGKTRYTSPERITGGRIDERSDIFSAGIVLWEAITGRKLFVGRTSAEVFLAIRDAPIFPPSRFLPGLPAAIDRVVLRALARDPDKRFQCAAEMRTAIVEVLARAKSTPEPEAIRSELCEAFGTEISRRTQAVEQLGRIPDALVAAALEVEAAEGADFVAVTGAASGATAPLGSPLTLGPWR